MYFDHSIFETHNIFGTGKQAPDVLKIVWHLLSNCTNYTFSSEFSRMNRADLFLLTELSDNELWIV